MELFKEVRSTQGKMVSPERVNLGGSSNGFADHNRGRHPYNYNEQVHHNNSNHHHPKSRIVKMFNKVQVVYYLTRNGHLEHPHYIEVSHLATQPLRLKDVIERLTLLRGKAMPCQYSWSCKRSYKNGFVWNDLTENDAIYATEGSEYVLKGSEIMEDRDFSEIRLEEHQNKGRKQSKSNSPKLDTMPSKAHQRHSFRQLPSNQAGQQNGNSEEYESEEEEKRVSCNSSNAFYTKPNIDDTQIVMQLEKEETYSLPSTSSTISDKPPPHPENPRKSTEKDQTKPPRLSVSKRYEEGVVVEEDGDPHSTALTRNPILLQLIACGGSKVKKFGKAGHKSNFNMGNALVPCLKQQLSTRGVSVRSNHAICECKVKKGEKELGDDNREVVGEDDQDMIMVRYMSENPRFWNLQSQEKEYFSGTIVETMTHHQNQSFGAESGHGPSQGPVLAKSSSYNELRSAKAGLEAGASKAMEEDEEDDLKVTGMIKLCLPRKKSCTSNSAKSNKA